MWLHLSLADRRTTKSVARLIRGGRLKYPYYFPNDPCTEVYIQETVLPDVSGNFTANMGVDFDGQACGQVYVSDANGNSTFREFYAYYLFADMRYNSVRGE